jgi:hypothetical protein
MSETEKIPIVIREVVDVTDPNYFCNKSWTLSYNVNTKSWVSFHSYIPNFYIAENNFFYSGLNSCCDDSLSLDVISTVVLPPSPTTTTSSTSSSSTTSTTSTKAPDCNLEGTTIIVDCSLEGTAILPEIPCNCYTITNITLDTQTFSYTQCDGTVVTDQSVLTTESAYICARVGTVVLNGDYFNVTGPLGTCTTDGECTTSSTTSSSTTLCPNCKTYTLENNTSSNLTATQLINCTTGLLYSFTVPGNTTFHVCSCSAPIVPTGMTSTEFGSGCTTCFCYTVTNIEGVENYITYVDCSGNVVTNEPIPAYSYIYVCAQEATILSNSEAVSYTGGTTSCTDNEDCDCWDC